SLQPAHALRPVRGEELLAQLEAADGARDRLQKRFRPRHVGRIDSAEQGVFRPARDRHWSPPTRSNTSPAAARSSRAVPTDLNSVISSGPVRPARSPRASWNRSAATASPVITP